MAVLKAEAKNFNNADAGAAVTAGEHGRVRPRWKIRDDRRFAIVRWRDSGRDDVRFLRVSPTVVETDPGPSRVQQFKHRVSQRVADIRGYQRRSHRSEQQPLRRHASNDEPRDEHIVAGLNSESGRDVERL